MATAPTALLAFVLAAALAALLTPACRALALRLGALDRPEPGRKLHAAPVPRPGGAAVWAAATLALLGAGVAAPGAAAVEGLGGLLLAGALVAALGLYDDLRWAGAPLKLAVQVAAALAAVRAGWRLEAVALPGLPALPLGPLAAPATVLWLAFASNAVNLVDGLDGLAAGLALAAAAALGAVAALHGRADAALLCAALAGAAAGFLPWNRHPARIFLGDSGALFLGFMLGAAALRCGPAGAPAPLAWPASLAGPAGPAGAPALPLLPALLALAVPLGDAAFAVVRRVAARRHPFKGDLGHLHHRLLAAGLDHPGAVRRLHLVAAALAALGVAAAALSRAG